MDPETRFTDDEVQKILARAARHQQAADHAGDAAGAGLSLRRLQEVAADVGIAPTHVEAAAREVVLRREQPVVETALALPRSLGTARVIPGTVSDTQWQAVVSELRTLFRKSGVPSQFGAVREWVSSAETADGMPVIVRMEPDPGGTRITIEQSLSGISIMIWALGGSFSGGGILAGLLAALGLVGPEAMSFGLFLLVMAFVIGGGTWLFSRIWSERQQKLLERAADRTELILRSH